MNFQMFCRACSARGVRLGRVGARSLASPATDGAGDAASPLRRLLDDASAYGEAAPGERELQWATQPYAAAPGAGGPRPQAAERTPASVLLFPGQGAQRVGMGRRLHDVPAARDLYELASSVVGWDVWRVCTEGPAEELDEHCQVGVLVTALAALERAREERPGALQAVRACAGFSLGELGALVFAGALPLPRALRLAEVRAAAMRAAAARRAGGMLTLWLAPDARVPALLAAARDAARARGVAAPVCQVAVYLQPGCKVVAGDEAALRWLEAAGAARGVRRAARVRVAGAYHSALMAAAEEPVRAALAQCELAAPRVAVYSGAEARPYRDAAHVRRGLARLAAAPLRWEQTLQALYARPRGEAQPLTLALGPAAALRASLKQVNARAWDASLLIDA